MNKMTESKRLVLEQKYKKELGSLFEKAVRQKIYTGRVDEGLWDSIKHGMAKLTSLRKYLPSAKRDAAEKQIQAILDKADQASSKAFSDLGKKLKAAGYPNQKDPQEFLAHTLEIGQIYDSIVASVEKGETDPKVANEMIKDLRKLLQYYMDYELESVYKRLAEAEDPSVAAEEGEAEGPLTGGKNTMSMEELKSTLAPKLLGLGGLAGILAGVLMHSDWFYRLIMKTEIIDMRQSVLDEVNTSISQAITVGPGEGPTQAMGRWFFNDPNHYGPNVPFQELLDDMKEFGLSDEELASLGRGGPQEQAKWLANWKQFQQNADLSLGKVFGAAGRKEIPWDVDPSKIADISRTISTTVVKTIGGRVKRTALTGIAATIGSKALGAASVLLPAVGIALVASGAAVYFLRKHGLKHSRLATLDGLLQRMNDVDASMVKDKETAPEDIGAVGDSSAGEVGAEEKPKASKTVYVYKAGEHEFTGDTDSLTSKLRGLDLPNWAVRDITSRIKQELETKGFVVKESVDAQDLLEKKRKKKRSNFDKPEITKKGGATRSAETAKKAREAVPAAMDRDVAGPGDNRGKISRMVIEFGSDTTVVKNGKTLKFSRKQLFDNPDEFIAALSPEEKALLMRLPEDPQKEQSKFDFFKMNTDQRKELYLKVKQGKVNFEKEFKNQPKAKEITTDTFYMSDLRDILETGHTGHGEQPIDPEKIRAAMKTIESYLRKYLSEVGVQLREAREFDRWSVLAGIKSVLRG